MKYDLNSITFLNPDDMENQGFTFFWKHDDCNNDARIFSQWFPAEFIKDGIKFNCAEQYMMAQKALLFDDMDTYADIMSASDPSIIKKLGRQINGFDETVWDDNKFQIVVDGNYAKFSQNPDLKEYLINTDTIIAEASPYDTVWGIGMKCDDKFITFPAYWKGQNLLGFALMEVRDMLIKEERNIGFNVNTFLNVNCRRFIRVHKFNVVNEALGLVVYEAKHYDEYPDRIPKDMAIDTILIPNAIGLDFNEQIDRAGTIYYRDYQISKLSDMEYQVFNLVGVTKLVAIPGIFSSVERALCYIDLIHYKNALAFEE